MSILSGEPVIREQPSLDYSSSSAAMSPEQMRVLTRVLAEEEVRKVF